MANYPCCASYINPRPAKLKTVKEFESESRAYLSLNVQLNEAKPVLFEKIRSFRDDLFEREEFQKEKDLIYFYPNDSLHFTPLILAMVAGVTEAELKTIIGEREKYLTEIVKKKMGKMNLQAGLMFANYSPESAYFVVGLNADGVKGAREAILDYAKKELQAIGISSIIEKGIDNSKNKGFCFPINFLRYKANDPSQIKGILGRIEQEFHNTENTKEEFSNFNSTGFHLTYSDQFWSIDSRINIF